MGDSWDDDDEWGDDAALEAKLEDHKKKQTVSAQDEEEEDFPALGAAPKAKSKPKEKPKPKAKKKEEPKVEVQEALADPEAEKKRIAALVDKREEGLTMDLFGGGAGSSSASKDEAKASEAKKVKPEVRIVYEDAFDQVELKTAKDVDNFLASCMDKLTNGKAKEAVIRFLTGLLKGLEAEMDIPTLQSLEKQMVDFVKAKAVQKTSHQSSGRNKANEVAKGKKFNAQDEMSTVYGGYGDDYDDWDEDDDYWEEG